MTLDIQLGTTEELSVTEKREIDHFIEQTISMHRNNRSEINKLTMESVTCLAASESRAGELASQGFFRRGWNHLTGKNQKIRADLDRNIAKSQYAAQQTIQKLAEQNLLAFDLVMAVNNKLNTLVLDIDQEINQVYRTLVAFFKHARSEMVQIEARLDKIERNVNLLQWNTTVEYLLYEGTEYSELNDIEKLICIVNDFFSISNGEWSTADVLLLKKTLSDMGLNVKGKIGYQDFFLYLIEKPNVIDRLFKDIRLEAIADIQPIQASLVKGIEKAIKLHTDEKYIVETIAEQLEQANVSVDDRQLKLSIIRQYLKNVALMATDREVNVFDFSLELLVNLHMISQGSSQLLTPRSEIEMNEVPAIEVGDYVEFGRYKGKKITWRVIHNESDTFMLFSHKFIDKMPFEGSGDWEQSGIRKFLNEEHQFLKEFSMNERDSIIEAENEYIGWHGAAMLLKYDENVLNCCSNYDEAFKKTTGDKVFLLSLLEVTRYLRNQRLDYRPSSKEKNSFYWLRDMSTNQKHIANSPFGSVRSLAFKMGERISNGLHNHKVRGIFEDGKVGENHYVDYHYVRPALYMKPCSPIRGKGTIEEPYSFEGETRD
jgi:hypothetical protein